MGVQGSGQPKPGPLRQFIEACLIDGPILGSDGREPKPMPVQIKNLLESVGKRTHLHFLQFRLSFFLSFSSLFFIFILFKLEGHARVVGWS